MDRDRNGLEVLDKHESLALLRTAAIGRVLVTVGALPAAFPVNFAVLDDDVVFRTGTGTKLHAAVENKVIGFEVDDFEARGQSGWSVLVTGHARDLEDPADIAAAERLPLQTWIPSAPSHIVRISSQLVTGRRLDLHGRTTPNVEAAADGGRAPWSGPAVGACRGCGGTELLPVHDGETTNFVCSTCAACWHVEQGWMYRVNPATCPGCSFRAECSRAYLGDALRREVMGPR